MKNIKVIVLVDVEGVESEHRPEEVASMMLAQALSGMKEYMVLAAPERFIPDEIRDKMLGDDTFLWEHAHMTFTGDGMEQEHAAELLEREDDTYILECYSRGCCDESLGLIAELRALGNERINKILDEDTY